jgi:hypothetical protein
MAEAKPVANDTSKPIDINFVGQSPHVFVYRLWHKEPGTDDWTKIGEGDTQDDIPDHHQTGPHPDGTQISGWFLAGGKKNSNYKFLVTMSQDGKVMHGGTFSESGKTSSDGGASKKIKAVLI